jgi:FkbM family methyltransferase
MSSQAKSKAQYAAKRLTRAILARLGLEIKHAQITGTQKQHKETKEQLLARKRARPGWSPVNLRKAGFSPQTIVDVGVGADGTPQLYEAFPEAFLILIEPLKEHEPQLKAILKEYEGEYFLTAVGAREENLIINVEPNKSGRSSIYSRTDFTSTGDLVEKREIPVTTLDLLMKKHNFRPPFGLKIDTEGFEYQVIEGAPNFLRETQFVIAEVSVARRFTKGYSFAEFIGIMDKNGFSLCDILHAQKPRAPASELRFVDAMFKRADLAPTRPSSRLPEGIDA